MAQAMIDLFNRDGMIPIRDYFVSGSAMSVPPCKTRTLSDFNSMIHGYHLQSLHETERRKRRKDCSFNGSTLPVDPYPTPVSSGPVLNDVNRTSTGLKRPGRRGRRPKSATSKNGSDSGGSKPTLRETRDRSSPRIDRSSPTKKEREKKEDHRPITAFFPVRRSDRRGMTSAEVKKARETQIVEKIQDGCEDGLQVMQIEGKGRGVVATKEFNRDDFVVEYAGELVNITTAKQREQLYERDERVGCYMYYFAHKNKHYCIDATAESGKLGRLVNHSRKGNCHTKVVTIGDRPYLVLLASQHIEKGEELTYDYGDRSQTALESHPWLKL